MKALNTLLGTVFILGAKMIKAGSNGNYIISVDIEFEGAKETLKFNSNNSELFELVDGAVNHSEILLTEVEVLIENQIEEYINKQ